MITQKQDNYCDIGNFNYKFVSSSTVKKTQNK